MKLLEPFLDEPQREWYGFDLLSRSGLRSGTVYPVLARLEAAGWLESTWEKVDPAVAGRPRRRLYRLTGVGASSARDVIRNTARRSGRSAPRAPLPQFDGGSA